MKNRNTICSIITIFVIFGCILQMTAGKPYDGILKPQSGQFYRNTMYDGTVTIADCRFDTPSARMVATAFQGLINRDTAFLYLYLGDHHIRQFEDTKRKFRLLKPIGKTANPGLNALFSEYSKKVKKIYIWDPAQDWTWNIALMLSRKNNGIPLLEEQKKELLASIPWQGEVENLSGRWAGKKEAYDWAIRELLPECLHSVLFSAGLRNDWKSNPWMLYDYVVASGGFTFWLDDADTKEQAIIEDICKAGLYKPGSIIMGYAKSGDDLLTTVNKYGIGYVVSDYYSNGSFWCAYPNKSFRQRPGKAIEAQPGKIYVSVTLSDGDNIQFDQNSLYELWANDTVRGKVPMGTTMCAGLQELNPFLLEWFYKNMTDNDELMAGPSGYQFIYGRNYAPQAYETWLQLNRKWIAGAGFETGCFWHTTYGTEVFKRYIDTSGLKGIFDGDDRVIMDYCDGVIVMNQGDHLTQEGDLYNNLAHRYRNADLSEQPLFLNTYPTAATWGKMGFSRMQREVARLEADFPGVFVFLLPKDLVATASRYYKENPHHRPMAGISSHTK